VAVLQGLYRAFVEKDAMLAEVNPLVLTADGPCAGAGCKVQFRQQCAVPPSEITALRDLDEEDPAEIEASKFDLSYISLDGDIGCLVNGAGWRWRRWTSSSCMAAIRRTFSMWAAAASKEKVTEAFKLMLKNPI